MIFLLQMQIQLYLSKYIEDFAFIFNKLLNLERCNFLKNEL
jgi:hypothetical protein